jgi:hypothetical protein
MNYYLEFQKIVGAVIIQCISISFSAFPYLILRLFFHLINQNNALKSDLEDMKSIKPLVSCLPHLASKDQYTHLDGSRNRKLPIYRERLKKKKK